MKCLKILVSLFLVSLCFPYINVSALEDEGYVGKYIYSEEERKIAEERALEQAMKISQDNILQTRMDEIVENWEKVGTGISNDSPKYLVFNQYPGGYRYGDGGGGMYWGESTATSGTTSLGVSIGGKYGSFSIAYAPGTRMESQGQYKNCPRELWYDYVRLYTSRRYQVTKYDVYRKNKYDSGKGTYVRSEYIPIPYSVAFYWQKV